MLKKALLGGFLAAFCLVAPSLCAAQQDLATADWSLNSAHSLATRSPSDEATLTLVKKVEDLDDPHLSLCSSRFADLRHSGNLSLLVSTNDGRFCDVEIIDKTASGFEVYDVDNSSAHLRDINESGSLELIAEVDLTSYEGASHCQATWPVIYAWTGSGYTDVSSHYKGYYQQKLASLKNEIAASSSATEQAQAAPAGQMPDSAATVVPAPAESFSDSAKGVGGRLDLTPPAASPSVATPAAMPDLADDCKVAEAAKIERFLGIDKNAGMSDAIKWANSADPNTREFASDLLFDIGTPDAIEYLRTLSNDSNPVVAQSAKSSLTGIGQGPFVHEIKREDLVESPTK
jgi:hypothetical protein